MFCICHAIVSVLVKPKIIKLEFIGSRNKTVHEEKKSKDWLAWNQDNMYEWIGMIFSWNNIVNIQLNVLVIHSPTWFDLIWYWIFYIFILLFFYFFLFFFFGKVINLRARK